MDGLKQDQLRVAVVVLAAGKGTRFGHSTNKVWLPLVGRRIILRSLENAVQSFDNCRTLLVISPDDHELASEVLLNDIPGVSVEIVEGGITRHESEYNALAHLAAEIEEGLVNVVLIHDGARPLASAALFNKIATRAFQYGGAIPAISVDPLELELVTDRKVVRVQTPQAFRAKELLSAYRQARNDEFIGTDTAACMERYFPSIRSVAVDGEIHNIKITYERDLEIAEHALETL